MKFALSFFTRLFLRWDREHTHVLLAGGYGLYLWIAQSFTAAPQGPGLRAMNHLAQTVAPEFDAEALWGSVMIGGGLLSLLGLAHRPDPRAPDRRRVAGGVVAADGGVLLDGQPAFARVRDLRRARPGRAHARLPDRRRLPLPPSE